MPRSSARRPPAPRAGLRGGTRPGRCRPGGSGGTADPRRATSARSRRRPRPPPRGTAPRAGARSATPSTGGCALGDQQPSSGELLDVPRDGEPADVPGHPERGRCCRPARLGHRRRVEREPAPSVASTATRAATRRPIAAKGPRMTRPYAADPLEPGKTRTDGRCGSAANGEDHRVGHGHGVALGAGGLAGRSLGDPTSHCAAGSAATTLSGVNSSSG